MTTLHINQFGGMTPAIDRRSMKKHAAVRAVNTVAVNGAIHPLREPKLVRDAGATVTGIELIRPFDGECYGLKTWTECTKSVMATSPGCSGCDMLMIHRDKRLYWVDPDNQNITYPAWIVGPSNPPVVAITNAGTGTPDERAYTYTYVDRFGVESSPAPASNFVTLADNGAVRLTGMGPAPANAETMRIYRSTFGFIDGREMPAELEATFQLVDEVPPAATFVDDKRLCDLCFGTLMTDEKCTPPETCCVVNTESGYLAGFDGNNFYVSARHDASDWPSRNRFALPDRITAMVANGDTIYLVTQGNPYAARISYNEEADIVDLMPYDEPYPCISAASLVRCPHGAMYASTRGLVLLTPQRPAHLISKDRIPEDEWPHFAPNLGAWYKGAYYGFRAPNAGGFVFEINEPTEQFIGMGDIFHHTVNAETVHVGYDDRLYFSQGSEVFSWGEGDGWLDYYWRSRVILAHGNTAFSVFRVKCDYGPDVNIRVWADGCLVVDCEVDTKRAMRFARYGRAQEYEVELTGRSPVYDVKLATSKTELMEGGL